MQYFRTFNCVINLSVNIFYSMERINWSDKLLDSMYSKKDVDSLSKVIDLVEDKQLIARFIQLLRIHGFKKHKELLKCLFQVIDFVRTNGDLLILSCKYGNLEIV